MSRQSTVPPRWNDNTTYQPGVVTWYSGCYWRCEKEHTSSLETSGAPTENPELWTQVATANPPQYQQLPAHPPAYDQASSGFGRLISSLPSIFTSSSTPPNHTQNQSPAMFEKQPHDMAPQDSTAFPSVSDEKRSLASNVDFVSEKVTESLRYITAQKEAHSAKDHDELKDELKGKRHWRVGGVGIWAYNGEGADENMKRDTWTKWGEKHGKDEWIKAARARTEFYAQDSKGVKPLIQWKLVERGGRLPDDALPMGHEQNGTILYAARAYWEGGMHLGKAGSHLINSASISYGGREHTLDIYEVLCGSSDSNTLRWRNYAHGEKAAVEGWYPVEGGREKNGTPIFIAKGSYEAGEHPGKCLLNDDHACIGYGGGELWIRPFQVLAYCSPEHR